MFLQDFLKLTRNLLKNHLPNSNLCIVLGNESCDLDSAVCAITLAYLCKTRRSNENNYLPVLNIQRSDYPLKTEVRHLFDKHGITMEQHLTFRDELSSEILATSRFILVDHHVSPYAERVNEVFDHRPFDESSANLPKECTIRLLRVGSCASLIAEHYLNTDPNLEIDRARLPYILLRSTILLDTDNLSKELATEMDCRMLCELEMRLTNNDLPERSLVYKELVAARADISQFTTEQLLRKDLKELTSSNGQYKIALPGFRMPVQQFLQKADAISAVYSFAKESNCDIVLLIGHCISEANGKVQRDIGLISIRDISLFEHLQATLIASDSPPLRLNAISDFHLFPNSALYQQLNTAATRKHIIPIVKEALETYTTPT